MHQQITNRAKFLIERMVLRGAHYRLLFIAALIGLVSLVAGGIVHAFGAHDDGGLPGAVWWAFLRLSDPGYLGDDTGTLLRIVSTVLTVMGYVLFLGALIAIMTQWLNQRMRDLEAGLTPIAARDHVLIMGWTNRTPGIVQELVMAGPRVRHFLQLRGARRLRIAILAEEVTAALGVELRERLGSLWDSRQVILRTGSPLRLDHLRRVDFTNAAAVILPSADFGRGGAEHADTRTVKTLLSMSSQPGIDTQPLPLAVAEIFDDRHVDIARGAYQGPLEIIASDAIISRLIAQNVRHSGLSFVYGELLTHGRGSEIYVRDAAGLEGQPFGDLACRFEDAIVLGIARGDAGTCSPLLAPPPDTRLERGDRVVLAAAGLQYTQPRDATPPKRTAPRLLQRTARERPLRVLLLGWNRKVPALLREFDSYTDEQFEIDIVSTQSVTSREAALNRQDLRPQRIAVRHVEGDYAATSLRHRVDVNAYDRIVLLGSARFETGEESDARTIMGYLLLRDLLPASGGPGVLIELLDPGNVSLFQHRRGEVIVSPVILSHMLAQVALRRELRAVFDELFGPGGAEIMFRPAAEFGLLGRDASFREIETAVASRAGVALGVRTAAARGRGSGGGVALNPPREQRWRLQDGDEIVALTAP